MKKATRPLTPTPCNILGECTANDGTQGDTELADAQVDAQKLGLFPGWQYSRDDCQGAVSNTGRARAGNGSTGNEHGRGDSGSTDDRSELKDKEEDEEGPLFPTLTNFHFRLFFEEPPNDLP